MWLALSIQCLECGAEHDRDETVLGLFATKDEAWAAVEAQLKPGHWLQREERGYTTGDWQLRVFEVELTSLTESVQTEPLA